MARTINIPSAIEGILYDIYYKQQHGYSPEAVLSFSILRFTKLAHQIRAIEKENYKATATIDILEKLRRDE